MFNKRPKEQNPYPFGMFEEQYSNQRVTPQMGMNNPNMSNMYPNFQYERLQYEIRENRRRINNLAKRIVRLENYLRIRDTSDYVIEDEINPNGY